MTAAIVRALAIGCVATGGAACSVTAAQVEVTDVCVTYTDVMVAGVAAGTPSLEHHWTFDKLAPIQQLLGSITDLEFTSIDARPVSGISSFAFVDTAHVTVASGDPTSPLPMLDVYDCHDDCVPDGNTLSVPSTLQTSAIAYVATGSVLVDLQILGQLPTIDWTMDVDACFAGTLDANL